MLQAFKGGADEAVGRSIDRQLIMRDEETSLVRDVPTNLVSKDNSTTKPGEILLDRDITPGETVSGQLEHLFQEASDKDLEHRVPGQGSNVAGTKRRAQTTPAPQHLEESPSRPFVPGIVVKIDLGQDLQDRTALGGNDPNVVAGCQITVAAFQNLSGEALEFRNVLVRDGWPRLQRIVFPDGMD